MSSSLCLDNCWNLELESDSVCKVSRIRDISLIAADRSLKRVCILFFVSTSSADGVVCTSDANEEYRAKTLDNCVESESTCALACVYAEVDIVLFGCYFLFLLLIIRSDFWLALCQIDEEGHGYQQASKYAVLLIKRSSISKFPKRRGKNPASESRGLRQLRGRLSGRDGYKSRCWLDR